MKTRDESHDESQAFDLFAKYPLVDGGIAASWDDLPTDSIMQQMKRILPEGWEVERREAGVFYSRVATSFETEHGIDFRGGPGSHGEAINLDSMDSSDLPVAAKHYALHASIRAYADDLAEARACRLDGKVFRAASIERRLERAYNSLPESLRW